MARGADGGCCSAVNVKLLLLVSCTSLQLVAGVRSVHHAQSISFAPSVRQPVQNGSNINWDDTLRHLQMTLQHTAKALDRFGWRGMGQIASLIHFLESASPLLQGGNDHPDNRENAWMNSMQEKTESYLKTLKELGEAARKSHEHEYSYYYVPQTHHLRSALEQQFLEDPLDQLQDVVATLANASTSLQKLQGLCTDGRDPVEDVYSRVWRVSEGVLKAATGLQMKHAYRALRKSAYDAVIVLHARAAQETVVHALCPAAANAARTLLAQMNRTSSPMHSTTTTTSSTSSIQNGERRSRRDTVEDRVAFLIGILNDPTMPDACAQIYRDAAESEKTTCMCEPGQCKAKVPSLSGGLEGSSNWACSRCGSSQCRLFWQLEACEEHTGCDAGVAPVKVVLGSKELTKTLLLHGIYFDPDCNGMMGCLKRWLGESRWKKLISYGRSLWRTRKDYLSVVALGSLGKALLNLWARAGASGATSLLDVSEQDQNLKDLKLPNLPSISIDPVVVRGLITKITPVVLGFLWIRQRVDEIHERSSAAGFCQRAVREISGLEALRQSQLSQAVVGGPVSAAVSEAAEEIALQQDHVRAIQLSEIFAGFATGSSEAEFHNEAAKLYPFMWDATAPLAVPPGFKLVKSTFRGALDKRHQDLSRQAFDTYDRDKDGYLTIAEFGYLLNSMPDRHRVDIEFDAFHKLLQLLELLPSEKSITLDPSGQPQVVVVDPARKDLWRHLVVTPHLDAMQTQLRESEAKKLEEVAKTIFDSFVVSIDGDGTMSIAEFVEYLGSVPNLYLPRLTFETFNALLSLLQLHVIESVTTEGSMLDDDFL